MLVPGFYILFIDKSKLGRWLGVSHKVEQYLCYWIFPDTAITIACTTVQTLINEESWIPGIYSHIVDIYWAIELKHGDKAENGDTDSILTDI